MEFTNKEVGSIAIPFGKYVGDIWSIHVWYDWFASDA